MPGNFEENAPKYARAGLHVFPCSLNKLPRLPKPPDGKGGFHLATTDLNIINGWMQQYPDIRDCSIGWCPGFSNMIILDFDTKTFGGEERKRPNGLNTLEDLLIAVPEMAEAWIIETATGGFHYIFSVEPDFMCKEDRGEVAPRMDIKFRGGYGILPNSGHLEGGTYKWIRGKSHISVPPMLPKQIAQMILEGQKKTDRDFDNIDPTDTTPIPPGKRHDAFLKYAGKLKNQGMTDEGILAELKAVNRIRCPDHDENDLVNIVKSSKTWSAGRALLDEVMYGKKPTVRPVSSAGNKSLKITWYDEIKPKPKEWLMPGFLPSSALTLWGGMEGSGKSYALLGIASLLSRGLPLPGTSFTDPIRSLLFTTEDDQETEITWRLEKCGADRSKVGTIFLSEDNFKASETGPLEEVLKKFPDVRLVVLDPATAFIGDIEDTNEMQVRGALQPLNSLAQKYKISVVLVKHMTKDESKMILNRFSGARAWTALPRTVILSGLDNTKEQQQHHRFCGMKTVKANGLAPLPLTYEINEGVFKFTGEDPTLEDERLFPKPPERNKK